MPSGEACPRPKRPVHSASASPPSSVTPPRPKETSPLEPAKAPGKRPKMDGRVGKLLKEDLLERPFVTLRERCEYVEAISGISVSRSTMCRAIARIGSTRKKGGEAPQSETSS